MRKQQIAIITLALWLTVIVSVFILLVKSLDFSLLFVLGFIGLLVIVQLTEPHFVQPTYLRYIRFLIGAGIIIFGIIVAFKVMDILAK